MKRLEELTEDCSDEEFNKVTEYWYRQCECGRGEKLGDHEYCKYCLREDSEIEDTYRALDRWLVSEGNYNGRMR